MTAQQLVQTMYAPTVEVNNGQLTTTSLNIAQVFEKQHAHVLRDISRISAEIPQEIAQSNFGLSEYKDETGKSNKLYIITQDGFTLLVMGYTGKKAMQFKLAYIQEFNRMREFIQNKATQALELNDSTKSTVEQREPLKAIVSSWCGETGIKYSSAWKMINAHFQLKTITELPTAWLPDAIDFVQSKIDEHQKALSVLQVQALELPQVKHSEKILEFQNSRTKQINNMLQECISIDRELSELANPIMSMAKEKLNTNNTLFAHEPFSEVMYNQNRILVKKAEELRNEFDKACRLWISLGNMQGV